MSLASKTCTPCRGGVAPMDAGTAEDYRKDLDGWELTHDATRLRQEYRLRDFAAALKFVNRVGELAEQENHHPEIAFGYGHVTLELWTHTIKGLHENDFILAAKIDRVGEQGTG